MSSGRVSGNIRNKQRKAQGNPSLCLRPEWRCDTQNTQTYRKGVGREYGNILRELVFTAADLGGIPSNVCPEQVHKRLNSTFIARWHTERPTVPARRVSMAHDVVSYTDFGDVALTLCTICAAVAHGRPVHGFFHVGRVALVVVVAGARGIGSCALRQAFVDVARVEGAGERALGTGGCLDRWKALGSEARYAVSLGGVGIGGHGSSRHGSR